MKKCKKCPEGSKCGKINEADVQHLSRTAKISLTGAFVSAVLLNIPDIQSSLLRVIHTTAKSMEGEAGTVLVSLLPFITAMVGILTHTLKRTLTDYAKK